MTDTTTLDGWSEVRDAFRAKPLRQALYDEGAVVMADCLLNLHGDDHRARRRLENRLFRRDMFRTWERDVLRHSIDEALAPVVATGHGDLMVIGYRITMNLTALVAGIDRPEASTGGTERLFAIVKTLSEGATLVHSTRDHDVVRAEVRDALNDLETHFIAPSRERRQALIYAHARGEIDEVDLPRDVLTTLLRNADDLRLPPEVVRREIAFYLQAGSHSTANAFTHTLDELFGWAQRHAAGAALLDAGRSRSFTQADRLLLQRCVHESLRLYPASPVAWRRPVTDIEVAGHMLAAGSLVVLDIDAANRDPRVWGGDADAFDPRRDVPAGIPRWGHSFGGGAHACIGAELDGGTEDGRGDHVEADHYHLFGSVAVMVEALLAAGVRPDPLRPARRDPRSSRRHFSSYPVLLDASGPRQEVPDGA